MPVTAPTNYSLTTGDDSWHDVDAGFDMATIAVGDVGTVPTNFGRLWWDGSDMYIRIATTDYKLGGTGGTTFGSDLVVSNGFGLIVGNATQVTASALSELQVLGTADADSSIIEGRWSADASGANLDFVKSRNATIGSNTIVANNDEVGALRFHPDDGVDFATLAAKFHVEVDDTSPAAGDVGAAFVWSQMAGGGGAISETMRLTKDGRLGIGNADPLCLLQVSDDGNYLGGTTYYNTWISPTATIPYKGVIFGYDTAGTIGVIGAAGISGSLTFWTHNGSAWGERVRISAAGEVGVGIAAPLAKHHINQTAAASSLIVADSGTTVLEVGDASTIGFFNTTPAGQQTSGADLTNNITSGGTDDTIDNWTDLSTYATDAAAIRNAVYQLSRKLKQVNDALRLFGMLT